MSETKEPRGSRRRRLVFPSSRGPAAKEAPVETRAVEEVYAALLAGQTPSNEEAEQLFKHVAEEVPGIVPGLCRMLLNRAKDNQERAATAESAAETVKKELEALRTGPLLLGEVRAVTAGGRVEVSMGGRRLLVPPAPEVEAAELVVGDAVMLSKGAEIVVGKVDWTRSGGTVAAVVEVLGAQVLLQGAGDERILAACAPALVGELSAGDRAVYRAESQCVVDRLPGEERLPFLLQAPPRRSFAEVAGIDGVVSKVRSKVDLLLDTGDLSRRYGLERRAGLLLAGQPGVGKTLIAEAVARYVESRGRDTRYVYVSPSTLRSKWYGVAEQRIHDVFAAARRFEGCVVVFLEEVDHFGARDDGFAQGADSRLLAALLAELDGLDRNDGVLVIAATNNLNGCDPALLRPGRLGDTIIRVPRPGRGAAAEILRLYLPADLPYADPDEGGPERLCEAAMAHLFAANGGAGRLAVAVCADARRLEVRPRDVMSGALLAGAAAAAKGAAATRELEGGDLRGITRDDLLEALDDALDAEMEKLRSPEMARRILEAPPGTQIVQVELPQRRRTRAYRYLRAA